MRHAKGAFHLLFWQTERTKDGRWCSTNFVNSPPIASQHTHILFLSPVAFFSSIIVLLYWSVLFVAIVLLLLFFLLFFLLSAFVLFGKLFDKQLHIFATLLKCGASAGKIGHSTRRRWRLCPYVCMCICIYACRNLHTLNFAFLTKTTNDCI